MRKFRTFKEVKGISCQLYSREGIFINLEEIRDALARE